MKNPAANSVAPTTLSPWMDTEEAARYMGCKPGSLKRWRCEGKGPRFRVVNRKLIRYHVQDLDTYICGGAPSPE